MSTPLAQEWQFDGLVGPTHNYAGLSYGNVASGKNAGAVSNPRAAALQGVAKMAFVRGLGVPQSFIPPQYRPIIPELQRIGFEGGTERVLDRAYRDAPHLLAAIYSSSYMWAANAATVSPSADSADGKVHFTPANLLTNLHRSLEPKHTHAMLRHIFADPACFQVHAPLASAAMMSDEGAANHMRSVGHSHGNRGLQIFVYGTQGAGVGINPEKFPARQHRAAYEAVARLHQLDPEHTLFVQQNPAVIDQGVFHNDVIAMNTTRLMIAHEAAFLDAQNFISALEQKMAGTDFHYISISENELPVADAVKSYFFNSQVLQLPEGEIVIVAPTESQENKKASAAFDRLAASNAVSAVHYLDVRESMRNGGGPACLRLRVVLTEREAAAVKQDVVLTEEKQKQLNDWIAKHYRDRLAFEDLRDPYFIRELNEAYAALEPIIGLPGYYTNQMA